MKHFILAAATLLLITGGEARERRGPPSVCPQPQADCCPKPKCPKPCPPKPCPPKPCAPKACKPVCKPACPPLPCEPCCPPVCFERGHETSDCCLPSAYTEPANIDLRCGWDTFVTLSFTYWDVMQDGMDLALPGQATTVSPLAGVTMPATSQSVLFQENAFKPGFQVGLGWSGGTDGWTLYGEYAWVRGTTHTSKTAPNPGVTSINGTAVGPFGVWIPTSWLPGIYPSNNVATTTTSISSKWTYGLDILDGQLSRPSYIGTNFVLEPLFGLRGLWIRQKMEISATVLNPTTVTVPSPRKAHYNAHSWAVGPRAGLSGKWHLGWGLRFIGDAAASLLYTSYDVSQSVDTPSTGLLPLGLKLSSLGALRPNLDLSLGLGWGSYFFCRRLHWDLAATYDFSVFWQQNMMRYLADLTADFTAHPGAAPGNLYLQGLTVKTAFDF